LKKKRTQNFKRNDRKNCTVIVRTYADVPTLALASVIILTTFSVLSVGSFTRDRPGTYLIWCTHGQDTKCLKF
jgi:hypothetical protein